MINDTFFGKALKTFKNYLKSHNDETLSTILSSGVLFLL